MRGFIAGVIITLFLGTVPVYAGGAANMVGFPQKGRFAIGFEAKTMRERKLIEYDDRFDHKADSNQHFVKFSYGFYDSLCVDLRLGQGEFDVYGANFDPYMSFGYGLAWGLGLRVKTFESIENGWSSGMGFQYYGFSPEETYREKNYFEADPSERYLSIDFAKEMDESVTLYGGVKYSEITIPFEHTGKYGIRKGGFEEKDNIGLFIGGRLGTGGAFAGSLELHLIDENAFVFGAGYGW